jgi:hypothetical protein
LELSTDRVEAYDALQELKGNDLKAICLMFELPAGSSKHERITRLLELGSGSYERLVRIARLVMFGYCAEGFVSARDMKEILSSLGLSAGGSKHEIFMTAVVNDKSPASPMLVAMNMSGVRKTYKCIFDEPPIWDEVRLKSDILYWLEFKHPPAEAAKPKTFAGQFLQRSVSTNQEPEDNKGAAVGVDFQKADQPKTFEYDVAISYASEDELSAGEIAVAMRAAGLKVWFAPYEQAQLWGKELSDVFKEIYAVKARFVLVLTSAHYAVKDFTDFEFTIARDEARKRKEEYILPVRLDGTHIVGLHSTVGYIEYSKSGPQKIVDLIKEKLSAMDTDQTKTGRFKFRWPDFSRD